MKSTDADRHAFSDAGVEPQRIKKNSNLNISSARQLASDAFEYPDDDDPDLFQDSHQDPAIAIVPTASANTDIICSENDTIAASSAKKVSFTPVVSTQDVPPKPSGKKPKIKPKESELPYGHPLGFSPIRI